MASLKSMLGAALVLLAACKAPRRQPQPTDKPPADNLPQTLQNFQFIESFTGTPAAIGCSDGQREGFADLRAFPNIAGCLGRWQGRKKLNADKTGALCGDDAGPCVAPADLCAPGWHICARDGNAADLKDRVTSRACTQSAGPGRFVAGMSHGQEARICPPPPGPRTRFPCTERGICSEPVCCGDACSFGACRDAVWRGKTRISRASPNGCGAAVSQAHGGVLCCRDHKVTAIAAADVNGQMGLPAGPKLPAMPSTKAGAAPAGAQGVGSPAKREASPSGSAPKNAGADRAPAHGGGPPVRGKATPSGSSPKKVGVAGAVPHDVGSPVKTVGTGSGAAPHKAGQDGHRPGGVPSKARSKTPSPRPAPAPASAKGAAAGRK